MPIRRLRYLLIGPNPFMPTFNHTAAIAYARQWAAGRNPEYPDAGGSVDCTNFISQCLVAGGWPMIPGYKKIRDFWWCDQQDLTKKNWSSSWAAAPDMAAFFWLSSRAELLWVTQGILPSVKSLQAGDVLMYGERDEVTSAEHACLVTWVNTQDPKNSIMHQHGLGPWRYFKYLDELYSEKWWKAWRMKKIFPPGDEPPPGRIVNRRG